MEKEITIALAEDHSLFRRGLISMLDQYKDIRVLFDVSNGQELLEKLELLKPDVILLDIDMPVLNGKQALLQIRAKYPEMKVIMLSTHYSEYHITDYIGKGASAYLAKNCDIDDLVETLHAVCENGYYYSSYVNEILSKQDSPVGSRRNVKIKITGRELEILELLRLNKSNQEIADTLCISIRTVESNRSELMQKTGSKNLAALVTYAIQNNLISDKPTSLS